MDTPDLLKARLRWVQLYLRTGHAGRTCLRCGISRPTLRKWTRRYQEQGVAGLHSLSRRPNRITGCKRGPELEARILHLRRERNLGPQRIQAELLRQDQLRLSTRTIWKALRNQHAEPLRKPARPRRPRRYSRPIPGERIQVDSCQVDSCQVVPGLYQFTAIDDCTRFRVLGLYPRRSAKHGVHFLLERVLKEFPFPIQRLQSDRGGEFFGLPFQLALHDQRIKFRPIRPYSPHLNGKVERSQLTDKVEFYATVDVKAADLAEQLRQWQHFYNHVRPHGSLGGRTPMERFKELADQTPRQDAVWATYSEEDEPYRERDWEGDQEVLEHHRLKRRL